jgi:hypothetical protein
LYCGYYLHELVEKVRFEDLTTVNRKINVFWDVSPSGLVDWYKCCGGTCRIHLQGVRVDRNRKLLFRMYLSRLEQHIALKY